MAWRGFVIAACLLGAGACTKDEAAPAAAPTPEQKRTQECERFAGDMARTGLLAGQVMVTALSDDPARASEGRREMEGEARALQRKLFDQCMRWPDDVMQCLPPLGILKDGCEEKLLAAMDDARPAPQSVPAGPAPAWSFALPSDARHLAVASDGTVLVVVSDGLVGVRDGKLAWRTDARFDDWLLPPSGEPSTWVVGAGDRVVGFDPADGKERWEAKLPRIEDGELGGDEPDDEDDEEVDAWIDATAAVQAAVRLDDGTLLVGDSQARFFRVDPRRCAPGGKPASACITAAGRLPDEVLEDDARLFVDANGKRYLWESDVVRAFAGDPAGAAPAASGAGWRTLMTARAHDSLSHVSVDGERLVLVVDDEVIELDATQCRGEAAFAPSEWPQPGVMYLRESDRCSDCEPPPPGCRRSRTFLRDLGGPAPALLRDGAVVVHHDGYTLALHAGAPRWKAFTGGGPLVTDGTRVLGLSTGLREGDAGGAFELDPADGTFRWRSVLPLAVGEIYDDDIRLALGGAWLAVAHEQTVVAIPLPPAA